MMRLVFVELVTYRSQRYAHESSRRWTDRIGARRSGLCGSTGKRRDSIPQGGPDRGQHRATQRQQGYWHRRRELRYGEQDADLDSIALVLSGDATAAHFHGPADAGANAGVAVPIKGTASPMAGSAAITDAQAAELLAGKWYINVHTAANKNGEIRGQVLKAK